MSDTVRIEYMPLSALKRWPRNPKAHDIGALHTSISRFGFVAPITIDERTGKLAAGHGRLDTLQQMKASGQEAPARKMWRGDEWFVPVIRGVGFNSDSELEAYLVADNRLTELGGWEADNLAALLSDLAAEDEALLEATGYDADDLDALLSELGQGAIAPADPGAQVDRAAELLEVWQVERGQVWEVPSATVAGKCHRVMCGDSTSAEDVARLMDGEKADMVFTSPPYAVGIDYGEYNDTIANLRDMLPILSHLWLEVVLDGGFAVVNFGDIASGRDIAKTHEPCEYPMALEYWPVFRSDGWLLWSRRIWCKPTPRVHSPWCIQSNRAATDFEHLWTWRKPGQPIIKRIDGEFSSVNGWYQSSHLQGVDEGKNVHGAGMATGIAQWMLTTHSRAGHNVFEPFSGSGTTLIACEQTGRIGYGMELEPKYVAVTLQRLADMGLESRLVEA